MPHLLINRLRTFPFPDLVPSCVVPSREGFPAGAYSIELLDIIAAIIFVAGSTCFLPRYSRDIDVFLDGCLLFIIGSCIYLMTFTFTFAEAIVHKGLVTFEVFENCLYLLGSIAFLFGTILYWPAEVHYEMPPDAYVKDRLSLLQHLQAIKKYVYGQRVHFIGQEGYGSTFFVVGSTLFAFAAFCNALGQTELDKYGRTKCSIASLHLAGSLLFAVGSMAFLATTKFPEDMVASNLTEQLVTIGAWLFISGSLFFLIAALLSFSRTMLLIGTYNEKDYICNDEDVEAKLPLVAARTGVKTDADAKSSCRTDTPRSSWYSDGHAID